MATPLVTVRFQQDSEPKSEVIDRHVKLIGLLMGVRGDPFDEGAESEVMRTGS